MRLLIHDFAGHPFQMQLSRRLAARGHSVVHLYAAGLPGPKGHLSNDDRLSIRGIPLPARFQKYSAYLRFWHQREYARAVKGAIGNCRPDVVLSGNTPIDVQAELLGYCRRIQVGFVHWVQDIYCQALRFFLDRQFPRVGKPIAPVFELIERWVASQSDHNVLIAADFGDLLRRWKIPEEKVSVIENWASLDDMPELARENDWSRVHNFGARPVLLYSGTIGMKHRPDLLYALAERLQSECTVVLVGDGAGRENLSKLPALENLRLLPFEAYETLPEVLASADVLLATLDTEAKNFAVPSKILAYLCAGRPILFAGPKKNLAAVVIERSGGGLVIDPNDVSAFVDAARKLVRDERLRGELGRKARSYAEETFDIEKITDAFEAVLLSAYKLHTRTLLSPSTA